MQQFEGSIRICAPSSARCRPGPGRTACRARRTSRCTAGTSAGRDLEVARWCSSCLVPEKKTSVRRSSCSSGWRHPAWAAVPRRAGRLRLQAHPVGAEGEPASGRTPRVAQLRRRPAGPQGAERERARTLRMRFICCHPTSAGSAPDRLPGRRGIVILLPAVEERIAGGQTGLHGDVHAFRRRESGARRHRRRSGRRPWPSAARRSTRLPAGSWRRIDDLAAGEKRPHRRMELEEPENFVRLAPGLR